MSDTAPGQTTGGEAVVRTLVARGLTTIFGVPGIQNDWLFNALYDHRDEIRVLHTRHEQGAGYLALGFALATGEIGVCSVVPGPGVLNSSAALATAYGLNARMLLLAGQIPSGKIGHDTGALHEIPDQLGILRGLTKWAVRVPNPAMAPQLIDEAIAQLMAGRPRPVAVEVPMDVLAQRAEVEYRFGDLTIAKPAVDSDAIESAARILGAAREPMIFVGGGAQDSAALVLQLAELLEAPVVSYRTGRGVVDSRHYLSFVQPAARPLWDSADVVLGIGTNMRVPLSSWPSAPDRKIIRIDVDPQAASTGKEAYQVITARAEDALPRLIDALGHHKVKRSSRRAQLEDAAADWHKRSAVLEPQITYLRVIRDTLGDEGIFLDELTQVGFASRLVMPVHCPRTFISTGYMGTLGYGFPTSLGVKVARPDRRVVSISGDGGFMFGVGEVATAVQHNIGAVAVVFNNNQYGNVQQMQRALYGNRVIASDLRNPDFVKLGESFGIYSRRAKDPQELGDALEAAFDAGGPALIEVPVGDMPSVDQFR